MRILLIGATGTIGQAIAAALRPKHELLLASHSKSAFKVDMVDIASIKRLYASVGRVDAVISAVGPARFKPLADLTDEDFRFSIENKLMGQVNLVRYGFESVSDKGSITITGGVLGQQPTIGSGVVSLVNAALEGFAKAAALEAPRAIRVNLIAPPWVTETLKAYGMPLEGGMPAAEVAEAYVRTVEGTGTGQVVLP